MKLISKYITILFVFVVYTGWTQQESNHIFSVPTIGEYTATKSILLKPGFETNSFKASILPNSYTPIELTSNKNFVYTRAFQKAMVDTTGITSSVDIIESITYYDGLGRPIQQRAIKASPNLQDIVTHITYDQFGRQDKQYLPFESDQIVGNYQTVDEVRDINTYYKQKYPQDFENVPVKEVNPYTESIYEPSPLQRVVKKGAPGKSWKSIPNSQTDHTIKFTWDTNMQGEIPYFKVDFEIQDGIANTAKPILERDGFYQPYQLHINITKDENWTPLDTLNHTTREYKDKSGRVVLKRTYNQNKAHDTHYVYDKFGNLSFVIPPKVDTSNDVSNVQLNELCYQYTYDQRNRLVTKKIPGKGLEYIIYNRLDQPIMTQDANQRENKEWLFTKYDPLGRVAYTGVITDQRELDVIRTEVRAFTGNLWVDRGRAFIIGGTTIYYNNNGYPNTQNAEILTINYYDNYAFLASEDITFVNPSVVYGTEVDTRTKSLVTASKIKVLETSDWITSVTYYDKKARPIYVVSVNEYLNTIDKVENKLDFTGKVLETKSTHIKDTNAPIWTIDRFEYDHTGRLLTQKQIINEQPIEVIAQNAYDQLGQLVTKTVGGGLQEVDYTYNVRGWLRGINDVNTLGNDLFAFGINYNTTTENLQAKALYNGNISETTWKAASDNIKRAYGYQYDALNRITHGTSSDGNYDLSNVTYDKMGNILSLDRKGHVNKAATAFGDMDILSYEYDMANKLVKVTDIGSIEFGFKDGTNTNEDFVYDINGNMIVDRNKGISGITYNHLNLPNIVSITNNEGSGNINYIYDATGAKQKKLVSEGSSLTQTVYAGNYVYKNGELQFFNHPEGYVERENDGTYSFVYQYKDHLGNIRLSYADRDKDGKVDVLRNTTDVDGDGDLAHEIMQEKNYYPFGLQHKGYNNVINGREHSYKFQGKELNEELGLDWYDFHARNYDSSLGRWFNMDNHAESYMSWTPYNFAYNSPLMVVDPDGQDGIFINEQGKEIGNDGIDDGKVYVVKTTSTTADLDSGVSANGITKSEAKATEKFIKANSGDTSAFQENSIAYDNSVEIEGNQATRQSMVDIVEQDNGRGGTKDANNREYGGVISNDGTVTQSPAGDVVSPKTSPVASIEHTTDANTKGTFHSHPSGTIEEGRNTNSNTIQMSGTVTTYDFSNAPSSGSGLDVNRNRASGTINYTFARKNGKVYIYNSKTGVQATLPHKRFVNFK